MGNNKLTPKQDQFAWDVANKTYNFIWEAHEASYPNKMSQNTRYQAACRLRSNSKVVARIKELEDKIKAKEKVTLDEIIVRLSKRNEVNAKDYFNDDGTFKVISELTDDQAVFITGIKVSEIWGKGDDAGSQIGRIVDVKLESFKDIMDMLIKHYGGYVNNVNLGGGEISEIKDILKGITGAK